jgi:ADP-heptose:LPS heptosyltransferase
MIDVLKHNFPKTSVDFLVNTRVAELILDYPNISKVHSIEKDSIKVLKPIFRENKYDLAIVVHPDFSIAVALFQSGIKYRLGTGYRWYSFLFNIKRYRHRKYSDKHEMEYNLDLLKEIGCEIPTGIKPVLTVKDETIVLLKDKIIKSGLALDELFIIIHPGSLKSAKEWGSKNFAGLINLLLDDNSLKTKIVLTGSINENAMLDNLLQIITPKKKVIKITNVNLIELAALIKCSKLFIGNSTGPIHIAAAVGTFVIGLYPAKTETNAARWGPYTDKKKVFSSGLKENESEFLDDIEPVKVFNFIKSYINSNYK